MADEILAVSASACFYPGLRAGEKPQDYDGTTFEWTFELPQNAVVGAGVYRLSFVRTLAEEEALGNPVLGNGKRRSSDDEA